MKGLSILCGSMHERNNYTKNKLYEFDIERLDRKDVTLKQISIGQVYFESDDTIINMEYLLTTNS